MDNLNLFDMLGGLGIEAPAVEKKEEAKENKEKKAGKKTEKISVVKNSLTLPGVALLNNWGKLELSAELLGVDTPTVANTVVEQYIKENIPCAAIYDFTYEGNTVLGTYTGDSSSLDIKEGDKFYLNGLELDLSDVCGDDVKSADLIEHLNTNGYTLGKATLFAKKDGIIMPCMASVPEREIKANLMYPVTIKVAGAEDIVVNAGSGEVTAKALSAKVIEVYPALKGKISFVALDKALNQIFLNVTASVQSTQSKKKTYKIKPTSVIKWEGYYPIAHNMDGEYTLEDICKYFADNIPANDSEGLKEYFTRKNCAERMEITPHKEFDLFYLCLKGGRKGAK